ncbi:hypothetical protein KC952_02885 [Candidatus Saccharibacteria bacterium]|jgi:hypothetical protein|nr:hypothetical protein [Candidatus Saccharibacteria bacterium]
MKYIRGLIVMLLLTGVVSWVGLHSTVIAKSKDVTSQETDTFNTQCVEVQASLNQLQQSDTLLRYNIGATYRGMSEKLMVPLNQRIAATSYDGSELVRITAQYNKVYQDFYQKYKLYSNKLQAAIDSDCKSDIEQFSSKISEARQARIDVYGASQALTKLLLDYRNSIDQFKKQIDSGNEH